MSKRRERLHVVSEIIKSSLENLPLQVKLWSFLGLASGKDVGEAVGGGLGRVERGPLQPLPNHCSLILTIPQSNKLQSKPSVSTTALCSYTWVSFLLDIVVPLGLGTSSRKLQMSQRTWLLDACFAHFNAISIGELPGCGISLQIHSEPPEGKKRPCEWYLHTMSLIP